MLLAFNRVTQSDFFQLKMPKKFRIDETESRIRELYKVSHCCYVKYRFTKNLTFFFFNKSCIYLIEPSFFFHLIVSHYDSRLTLLSINFSLMSHVYTY